MISFEPETFFPSESSAVALLKEDGRERHPITLVYSSDVSVGIWLKLPPLILQAPPDSAACNLCSSASLLLEAVLVWASSFLVAPMQASPFCHSCSNNQKIY